ncbi:hypothetical protein Tco_1230894 [Tanacetum coccineum]
MIGWIMTCISTPKFTICVNGERFRYFRGGKGLRQGGPISSYIFTVVMEMLNLVVKDEIGKEKAVSVQTLKKALYKFSAISRLHPNLGKCTMLCGSLDDEKKNAISFKLKQRSVWDVDVDPKDSRGWKCLLNLRSWIGEHMRYRIRDGSCLSNTPDKPILLDNNGKDRRFFTNIVWKDVRGNNDKEERNLRLFNNSKREVTDLFDIMIEDLRAKMVSITVKESNNVIHAESVWNVKFARRS